MATLHAFPWCLAHVPMVGAVGFVAGTCPLQTMLLLLSFLYHEL
jgi:hypothetical protein